MSRRKFVGGNWKCNGSTKSITELMEALNTANLPQAVDFVVAPPTIYLELTNKLSNENIQVSAQNCYFEAKGAFTGEISADMIKDMNIPWVILGHSERRQIFNESEEDIGKKAGAALASGISVIACVGETLEQRKAGKTTDIVIQQLEAFKAHIQDWKNVVIAYEPVWAIGTGEVATPAQAQEVHFEIRKWLADLKDTVRIIYGGSVKAANAVELGQQEDIDGFLVGGASLIPDEIIAIVKSCA